MAFRSFAKEGRKRKEKEEVFLAVTTSGPQTAVLLNTEEDILSDLNNFLVPRVGI